MEIRTLSFPSQKHWGMMNIIHVLQNEQYAGTHHNAAAGPMYCTVLILLDISCRKSFKTKFIKTVRDLVLNIFCCHNWHLHHLWGNVYTELRETLSGNVENNIHISIRCNLRSVCYIGRCNIFQLDHKSKLLSSSLSNSAFKMIHHKDESNHVWCLHQGPSLFFLEQPRKEP